MRHALGTLLAAAMLVVLAAAPAFADKPMTMSDSRTSTDTNACTGLDHEITRDFTMTVHEHRNNTVVRFVSSLETDDGFEGTGRQTSVTTKNVDTATINFVVANPDTGAKYRVKGHFTFDLNQGELRTEAFAITCIKGGA